MVPYLARGAKQLGAEEKAQGTWSLVHGDYKIDNLIFGRSKKDGKWRVVGVLDWELCTLGSPVSHEANGEGRLAPRAEPDLGFFSSRIWPT
jgi:aminoglycoside phosphotransferase (APT) family kinase protein